MKNLAFFALVISHSALADFPSRAVDCDVASSGPQQTEGLDSLSYGTSIVGFGPEGRVENEISQVPDVALEVEDGWIVGSSRGEWGGEIAFVPRDGEAQILLEENVFAIYEMPFGIVVVGGLAHLGLNSGSVTLVERKSEGGYKATTLYALHGAPQATQLVGSEGLVIHVLRGGQLLLAEDGTLSRVRCVDANHDS